ncbi:chalcone isomerase family protein [Shewanella sp. JM162201]|uniref:Chalcone isomerase family protein n=1 Tax=Shewanella jiangmenensis TaxID=2837387 RepID=A0ABS5V392_9GAMM|nr:chalcone isomerase family protein [Shewanella jiangmenensis]MBT1444922.1 chalcone isomerase family protein [Shewanella jiangmenensis]
MKYLLTFALAGLCFFASAKEVAGVDVPDNLSLNEQTYVLNGAGVRDKFFMDLYVGSLYLPAKANSLDAVLSQSSAIVRLDILSDLITSEKMRSAITEGFDAATAGKQDDAMKANIAAFMALFDSEIKPGDRFVLLASDAGVTAYKNDVAQPQIGDKAFAAALISIWLGDKPAQKSLKSQMLGK